jgi:hypothetical protein
MIKFLRSLFYHPVVKAKVIEIQKFETIRYKSYYGIKITGSESTTYSKVVTIEVIELLPQSHNILIGQRFQKEYEACPFSIGDIAVINLENWDQA